MDSYNYKLFTGPYLSEDEFRQITNFLKLSDLISETMLHNVYDVKTQRPSRL